ncbi:MAG: efflux RND transporter periplasmic adaptor subunit [Thermovirgaceae bacterium]
MSKSKKRQHLGRWLFVLVLLLVGAFLLLRLRAGQLEEAGEYRPRPLRVLTQKVLRGNLQVTNQYLAFLEPAKSAEIAPKVTATILEVKADIGDEVSTGDVLAVLDGSEIHHQLDALDARISEAASELEGLRAREFSLQANAQYWAKEADRAEYLVAEGAIPKSDAEAARVRQVEAKSGLGEAENRIKALASRRASLQAEAEVLKERVGYYTIRSPFDGVVTKSGAEPGNLATIGAPLFSVESRDGWELVFRVPQEDLPLIKKGRTVWGRLGEGKVTGEVRRVSPSVDGSRMARAEAEVLEVTGGAEVALGRGVSMTVNVATGRYENVLLVPKEAVIPGHEKPFVYVVSDGSLKRQGVQVLAISGKTAAVEGLAEGDVVVVHSPYGWAELSEGREVTAE